MATAGAASVEGRAGAAPVQQEEQNSRKSKTAGRQNGTREESVRVERHRRAKTTIGGKLSGTVDTMSQLGNTKRLAAYLVVSSNTAAPFIPW